MTSIRNLLLTGAAGFIGSNFAHYWRNHHPADRVVVLDALTYAGNRRNLAPLEAGGHIHFVHGSINDAPLVARLLKEHDIDTIVHFAAETHVDRSIMEPDAFIHTNITGTHTLLKQAREAWLKGDAKPHRFHHVSTDEVYGSLPAAAPPSTELAPYAPNSPYAASKAASDHLVRAYHRTYGLNITLSRCCNNYGPYQFPEKLIPLCLLNILQGRPLPLYGDGQQIRDWLYMDDHSHALDLIINHGEPGETYNVGATNEQTNLNTVTLLCDIVAHRFTTDPQLPQRFPSSPCAVAATTPATPATPTPARDLIRFVPDRPGHDTRYAIDPSKLTTSLGYRPRTDFQTGLEKTVDWYLSNEEWWHPLLQS